MANALLGLGIGMAFASMANLIVEAVPQRQTGEATGMNTIMRTIGGALGAQVSAALVAGHVVAGTGLPAAQGYTQAFALGAAAFALALAAGSLVPGHRRAPRAVPEAARA